MIAVLSLLQIASAANLRPVRAGDTVEGLAGGDPGVADAIRQLNGLGPAEQPPIGQLLTLPPQQGEVTQAAFVTTQLGEVTVAAPGQSAAPSQRFVGLPDGGELCTGPNSFAAVRLATTCGADGALGDELVLWSDTCVIVRSVVATTGHRTTVLEVVRGSVVVPAAQSEGGEVTVVAGDGVATGKGGFRVHLEPDAVLRAEALTEQLAVLGGGQELVLDAGQGTRMAGDGPRGPVVDLLGAGPLVAPAPGEALRRAVFRWNSTEDAFGYQLSVSADARGVQIVYQRAIPEPAHAPERLLLPIEPGQPVWWRIASLDRLGFLGVPTAARPFGLPGRAL